MKNPQYLFETSWEICNMVGGIYTVLSTKALTAVSQFNNNYICIGPDLMKEDNSDFIEDVSLFKNWKETATKEGLKLRIGRWNVPGNPIVILVDFTPFFDKKDDIFTKYWEYCKLDSLSGEWDYIEPALFGYAAGRVILSFYDFYCSAADQIVAHFHEWMTGTGVLLLEKQAPQIATVFTTHATVLGRCIAGNGLPLYEDMEAYHPHEYAQKFGVKSKYSLELLSATHADAFTTVSEITNRECSAFLTKPVDVVTINGFENNFVPQGEDFTVKRKIARQKLIEVTAALTQQPVADDALFVINSGRYEFKNKGIDLFIDALAQLKKENLQKEVVAYITVPAGTSGFRHDLQEQIAKLQQQPITVDVHPALGDFLTHPLHDPLHDPVLNQLHKNNMENCPKSGVKVVFVPVYLNAHDGIFNLSYYDLLIGFDLSVFPSYYEPWGYTPLESIAFGIPTVTTTLAGFGMWTLQHFGPQKASWVIARDDHNDIEVRNEIANAITYYANITNDEKQHQNELATQIAQQALWNNLYLHYNEAYTHALSNAAKRESQYCTKVSKISLYVDTMKNSDPKWVDITVMSELPESLKSLKDLAHNLWWSWNYEARELFEEIIGSEKWEFYQENPTHALQMLPWERIEKFANNPQYLTKLEKVYQQFQNYMAEPSARKEQKIAYFSMEFGISNELKIFSGGLGMLAGDYLKEASDCNVNMIGVGLLYRNGYFTQQISPEGWQVSHYPSQSFSKLPITAVRHEDGTPKMISIALPGRIMYARIWRVEVGRIPLYLLDTDMKVNQEQDREVTHSLYGGNNENRLKQELLLGVGGIRMLNLLGEKPTLYHLNEGHAAFIGLERLTNIMQTHQYSLTTAQEIVKASSLYTTHTPVPAGHDAFSEDFMRTYFSNYPERFNITWKEFMALGRSRMDATHEKFSMSILSAKLSQEVNGVSRIHGRVSREMFAHLYKGHFANELHIGYVTNGVHYPTWTHKKWQQYHADCFGDAFANDRANPKHWEKIYNAKDADLWEIKQTLRAEMLDAVRVQLGHQMFIRSESPELIAQTLRTINNNTLTVGFARRFATYKRAHLLFSNEERLAQIVNNPERPIQFLFAGKAHPHDVAGQELIQRIIAASRKPQFIGKIIFLENYDMILAKKLVSGCDIWLNTPTRPQEASGTSGEKAIMNGVLNFSVLDGWWAEGYVPEGGWAITEECTYSECYLQDQLDATTLYSTFEESIAKAYYTRNDENIPEKWTQMMKENFAKIAPHFTMKRQLDDYYKKFYHKLEERFLLVAQNNYQAIHQLVRWKERVIAAWEGIQCDTIDILKDQDNTYSIHEKIEVNVHIRLGILTQNDVKIEVCFIDAEHEKEEHYCILDKHEMQFIKEENGVAAFHCAITPTIPGTWKTGIRLLPAHPLLPHDFDFHLIKWLP